jgi:uncharacterized protein
MPLDLLEAPARQASSLEETAHRPWALPDGSWVLAETLDDQLFAHWRVSAAALREHLPDDVDVDEHDGSAWLGVTPFAVTALRVRGTLPLPILSSFHQVNVRTYVTRDGKPGIWFLSLEASSYVVVEAARRLYDIPFFHATITVRRRGDRVVWDSARDDGRAFSCSYEPSGPQVTAQPGSLEHFLTERYCLYAGRDGRLSRAEIHHRPWPLRPAVADIELNTLPPDWLRLEHEPILHDSARQDVLIWPQEAVTDRVT